MSRETEERLADWVVWFHQNKGRIPPDNLGKQNLFLLKAMDGLFEVTAMCLKDVQLLERRNPTGLLMPLEVSVSGDFTRFG